MDRFKLLIALVVVFVIIHVPSVSAQEDFIITVGQDKVFTDFNYHEAWFEDDPNDPSPWPDHREAYSEGNVARASLFATPVHAGMAQALVGVQLEWNLGNYTWVEVQNWPIRVTFNFSYQIEADYTPGPGSNAGANVRLPPFTERWYDSIGSEVGYSGSRTQTVTQTFTTTWDGQPLTVGSVESWGRQIFIQVLSQAQAHSIAEGGTGTNSYSYANVTINSIKIEFGPKLFVVIPGVGFGNEPEHGAMMLWRAVSMFRDDSESLKEIREVDNLSDEQVRQMIIEASQKAKEKGKDVIVNIDMDLDGFSLWEYIRWGSGRWQRSVRWAGRMANIVSGAFREENPRGVRMLYAHSAGVDATTQSIEQMWQMWGKRMYDDLNLLNGRTPATSLANALLSSGYEWWQVKVFTSRGDFPALPWISLSNYDAAREWAGRAWVHLHSLTIKRHNGLRDSISRDGEIPGSFRVNLGAYGSWIEPSITVRDLMLRDWRP